MSIRREFSVGCSEGGAFVVREALVHGYDRAPTLREALGTHLESLRQRSRALHAILASDLPEDAERLLLDGARMRIDEVTLRPPADLEARDAIINTTFGKPS
jgi:hypothetical protein